LFSQCLEGPEQPLPVSTGSSESTPLKDGNPDPSAQSSPPLDFGEYRTPVNVFGLYKIPKCLPGDYPHDPDLCLTPRDLQEPLLIPVETQPEPPSLTSVQTQQTEPSALQLHPFPNLSSFRLAEWWWSPNREQSQKSFQALLDIIGDDNFQPKDVREANWPALDRALATSQYEADDLDPNWENDNGISWACTSVEITVPFNTSSSTPGSKKFTVPGFHYCLLVPLIKRKLESLTTHEFFHTFGYELRWCPGKEHEDVRVYGEIYTSPAFLQAYNELQVRDAPL
jgi:hypothetical protein